MLNDCITIHNEQERRERFAALHPCCPCLDSTLDKNENVERYDPPIVKSYTELQPGDICRCEYGEYDNWTDVVFRRIGCEEHGWTQTINASLWDINREIVMWSDAPIDKSLALVVGRWKE